MVRVVKKKKIGVKINTVSQWNAHRSYGDAVLSNKSQQQIVWWTTMSLNGVIFLDINTIVC